MRPFRFLASINDKSRFGELATIAREAESIGCSTFVLADHLMGYAPLPTLAVVAAATERLRVGTFVINANLRHPAVLAQELATVDALSGGRLEIGIGAGWNAGEQEKVGIAFETPRARVDRLVETLAILKGSFADGPLSYSGAYYSVTDHEGEPKPVQRPHPPILLAGGSRRILSLAAREAQTIGLATRSLRDGRIGIEPRSMTAAATEEKIGWIRQAAGDRFDEIELNTLPVGGPAVITADPRAEARRRVDRLREQTGVELSIEEVLESPHTFIGTVEDLTRKCLELRERFGISSFLTVDPIVLAPVIEQLVGR